VSEVPEVAHRRQQVIVRERECISCGVCVQSCPTDVLKMDPETGKARAVYPGDCCVCLLCVEDCPADCIDVDEQLPSRFISIYDHFGVAL
jgi:NAD-dependent dihydropyrimidine dehydrogenase PreA subunit